MCPEVAVGARWALSLDHGREGAAASWELPTGSPLPAVESPPGPPRWLDSKLHQIPPGALLWAAPCLDPREPRDGPPHPVDLCSPLPDPQEPRAGPLHPTDVCSPLPRPVGAKGWASTPHGHLQPPAWTPGSGPGVGQEWAPTPGRVLQLPHQQLRGSGWLPLDPTAPSPPGAGHGVDLPFVVLEAPHPSPRGLHHLHHLPYPGRSLPPPASICALRAGQRTVPPQPLTVVGQTDGLGLQPPTPWSVSSLGLHMPPQPPAMDSGCPPCRRIAPVPDSPRDCHRLPRTEPWCDPQDTRGVQRG